MIPNLVLLGTTDVSASCGFSLYPIVSARVYSRRRLFHRRNVMPPILARRRVRTAMPMPAPAPALSDEFVSGGSDVEGDGL